MCGWYVVDVWSVWLVWLVRSVCGQCTLGEHAGVRVKRVKSIKSAGVGFKMPGKHIKDDYYKTKAK